MTRLSLYPGGLVGRIGFVLILAVVLQFVASTVLFEQAELVSVEDADAYRAADALETAARVLEATPVPDRPTAARALSRPKLTIAWRSMAEFPTRTGDDASALRAKITEEEPALSKRVIAIRTAAPDSYSGSARLADGSFLLFELPQSVESIPAFWSRLASVTILSGCVLLVALMVVRTLGSPLITLASAADMIGKGPAVQLHDAGPREVRRVARAFNAMQVRMDKLIRDRTEGLAAVSHDLRTPLARMRLRCGLLDETEDKAAFVSDLAEMEGMIADLTAFLAGENDPEKPRLTDIAIMLATLVDAATDAGKQATYEGPVRYVVTVRSLAMKRALSNLINNALTHGGCANVRLTPGAPTIVTVEDNGPGIPIAELTAVFEPFHRVNTARTAGSGGMGLGLAIARQAITRESGTITLENKPEGGLRVIAALPNI